MKQKYSLMIADIQLSVVTDAPHDEVEKIVGILDRRMREINLRSRRCSKNEAALLCALDFCSDRLALQDKNAELESRCEKYATVLDALKEQVADLKGQVDRLAGENEVLRSVIGTSQVNNSVPTPPPTPTEFLEQVAEAGVGPFSAAPEVKEDRSRVGVMFDQLSFEDV